MAIRLILLDTKRSEDNDETKHYDYTFSTVGDF